jgi:LysM repeat protein/ABC-type branched-subunit amino acid transport system substrate-binding protein
MKNIFLVFVALCVLGLTPVNAQNYKTHNVKKGETIAGIAARYAVTVEAIYNLNPDAKKALQPNTVLIIPIAEAMPPKFKETKTLEGFKKHKTKKKETLYGLAKRYNITEAELKKHNTFLYANNLRKGDKLRIPVFKIEREAIATGPKTYTVKPKEGKWRIAYKFGITVAELEALNPDMGAVLQEGQLINVPDMGGETPKAIDEQYSYYKVLPKEGFYRLKLKLNVEQETLETLNPELKASGLKAGMVLKIPFRAAVSGTDNVLERKDLTGLISDYKTKHIALMLPFRLNKVEFDSVQDTKESISKDPYLDVSLDFYTGVLTAIDSLKQLGVSVTLDVYDTKHEPTAVSKLLTETDFENVDAVVGPLTTKNFNLVSKALKKYNVPVVSPIGTNLKMYDNVFQSRPSDTLLRRKIINFVKNDTLPKHIVIVSDSKNKVIAEALKKEFPTATVLYSRKDKKGKDENYVMVDDIKSGLKPGNNIVFLETQNEGFASNVTSVLASLMPKENESSKSNATSIVLTTTRFNRAFEGDEINNTHLSKLQFHFATSSKSYSNTNNAFIKRYDAEYKVTPNTRAVKGFDLMMDVVLRLVTSKDLYMSVMEAPLTSYVENKFAYKSQPTGGYVNDAVYLVKYDNLKVVQVE